jgi:hypothetical protein
MGDWKNSSIIIGLAKEWSAVCPYPSDRRLGGLQRWSGRCGAQKNVLSLPEIEPCYPNVTFIVITQRLEFFKLKGIMELLQSKF